MVDTQTLLILLIILVTTFISSTLGFGMGLVAMPLLALFVDMRTATPLIALVALTNSFLIFVGNWKSVDFRDIWRLIPSSIVGIPVGLYILKGAGDMVMKVFLALMIIFFALYSLTSRSRFTMKATWPSYLVGFLSGLIGSAYNMGGPPVVIYGTLKQWPPSTFRATLHSFFFPTCVFIAMGHYLGGLLTRPVLQTYALALPIILMTTLVGGKLNRIIPRQKFNTAINYFLVFVGVFLLVKTIY